MSEYTFSSSSGCKSDKNSDGGRNIVVSLFALNVLGFLVGLVGKIFMIDDMPKVEFNYFTQAIFYTFLSASLNIPKDVKDICTSTIECEVELSGS